MELAVVLHRNPRIDDLSSTQRAKAANMPVHADNPYPQAKVLKTVTGLSCNRNANQRQDVSHDEALEGIKQDTGNYGWCQCSSKQHLSKEFRHRLG